MWRSTVLSLPLLQGFPALALAVLWILVSQTGNIFAVMSYLVDIEKFNQISHLTEWNSTFFEFSDNTDGITEKV
jgi:hypothetical protein